MDLMIYTDGAARGNPGKAAIGFSIYSTKGKRLTESSTYIGTATNNIAEYRAIIAALTAAHSLSHGAITCHSDSQLVISQLKGAWKVKQQHIKNLCAQVKRLEQQFSSVSYCHVPRENPHIMRVDRMINRELDKH